MDIEQYDASDPEKYLKGILHSEQEPWVGEAYQSYLAVLPSPLIGFDEFAKKVTFELFDDKRFSCCLLLLTKNVTNEGQICISPLKKATQNNKYGIFIQLCR